MDPVMLNEARQEEMKCLESVGMHELVPQEPCWAAGGGETPVGAKWIDISTNSDGETFVRSSFVARDLREKVDKREHLVAATPPLDTLKSLLAISFRGNLKAISSSSRGSGRARASVGS